jgi:hypothetical protein
MELHSFALENLEGRTLFSVAVLSDAEPTTFTAAPSAPAYLRAARHPLTGAFNMAGSFVHIFGNPDGGPKYQFTGSGVNSALGKFTMTGHMQGPGFVASGQTIGYLTITTSRGTLTVRVWGPPQAPGSLPPTMAYRISGGTGAYVNSSGKGNFVLAASDTTLKFVFKFNQAS